MSNRALARRLFAHGGLDQAERGKDRVRRTKIRIEKGFFIWRPAIIVMCKEGSWSPPTSPLPAPCGLPAEQ